MITRKLIPSVLVALLISLLGAHPASADSSHARIIRLSLVQGDVRFARETHGDPLADSNAGWETAGLNLPIRQGYVLATDKGRVSVLHHKNATQLEKGQSLTVKVGDDSSLKVGRLADEDDFDRWVSGRIDSVSTATTAAMQYTGSPSYVPGFADLYTYGAFSNCGGYGYGWRPFGVGLGWSPFSSGQWIMDPQFGWTWASFQPWGWAPYHYGGWLFDASCGGWFYSPPILYGYGYPGVPRKRFPGGVHPPRPICRPVAGVFVRQGGKSGIVPMHPLDHKGKA